MKVDVALVRRLLRVELFNGSPSLSRVRVGQHSKVNVVRTSDVDGVGVRDLVRVHTQVDVFSSSVFHDAWTSLHVLLLDLVELDSEVGGLRL